MGKIRKFSFLKARFLGNQLEEKQHHVRPLIFAEVDTAGQYGLSMKANRCRKTSQIQ